MVDTPDESSSGRQSKIEPITVTVKIDASQALEVLRDFVAEIDRVKTKLDAVGAAAEKLAVGAGD